MCSVSGGDATEFLWLKEGQLLQQDEKSRIIITPENSVLTIKNVDQSDAGTYVCVAKNSFSEDHTKAILLVKGNAFL